MAGKQMEETAKAALHRSGFDGVPSDTAERLARYLQEVDFWSGKIHLVGKGRLGSSLELLLLDSLALLKAADKRGVEAKKAADIGSGAGFPGLVWNIVRPGLSMTLFERRLKPQLFLERTVALLDLKGVTIVGEDAGRGTEGGAFDLVASKAAGRLDRILPLAERLLAPGGAYVTIKGIAWEAEIPRRFSSTMRLDASVELPEKRGTALIFRKSPVA